MIASDGAPDNNTPCLVFDRAALLDRVGGDEDILGKVLETFIEDAARQVGQLREMNSRCDVGGIEKRAHCLKSAAGSAGACAVARWALELEIAARGKGVEVADLIGTVSAAFDDFKIEIENRGSGWEREP